MKRITCHEEKSKSSRHKLCNKSSRQPKSTVLPERMNHTLMDRVQMLLKNAGIEHYYWGEAIYYAVYLNSRTLSKAINNRTPYEALLNQAPQNRNIMIFGCAEYILINKADRKSRLQNCAEMTVFVGIVEDQYRVYLFHSRRFVTTNHGTFNENKFATDKKIKDCR